MKTGGAGMIYEECLKIIEKAHGNPYPYGRIGGTARLTIIEALEKQIPKKPLEIKKTGTSVSINALSTISSVVHNYEGLCPNCKTQNTNRRIGTRVSYCENCGQALDWSDIDG